jgi:RHS repeat-associated protein
VSVAQPDGVDGLSTRVDRIFNQKGQHVKTERFLRANGAWNKYETETMAHNAHGRHITTALDGRTIYAASYKRLESSPESGTLFGETDETGRTKRYSYDALGKLESVTQVGVPASGSYAAQADIVTSYLRELGGLSCGCDGEVIATTTAGSLSLETKTKKDGAGRVTYEKDATGLETYWTYLFGGRQVNRSNPDGGVVALVDYIDGRPREVVGSGTIATYFDYGVEVDGTRWTKVSRPNGYRWKKTTTNHLGQVIQVETPASDGGVLKTVFSYNAKGQLWRTRQRHVLNLVETGALADTLFEYDALGNNWRSGSDLNGNGVLDLASADRITDSVRSFSWQDSAWWELVQSKVYPTLNSNAAVQVSETRRRLSGFSGALVAEMRAVDIDGNLASEQVEIDPSNKLVTAKLKSPDSPLFATSVRRNGLLVSQSTTTVAAPVLYSYDALGRVLTVKEPRHTQASSYTYHPTTGRLTGHTDAAGNPTTYTYYEGQGEAGAGRVKLVTNALGHTQRIAYDLLGRVIRQWGSASYPQSYIYSVYGELATLTTWRDTGAANLDQATWPALTGGDVTTWTYQGPTGLLTRKQYADGKSTDYGYDKFNRLFVRTWARTSSLPTSGSLLTTAYTYAAGTGQLETIEYSDDTPDVSATYDRLGRPLTVTDATGTRSFAYDPDKLRLDAEILPSTFYGSRILKRDYQTSDSGEIPGRIGGYQLGTVSDPDQDFAVSYGYDGFGRLNGVTSPSGAYAYGYTANSNLLATITGPVHVATRTYETNRSVVDILENSVGASTVSKFDYTVNAIGQPTGRARSGSAFAQASTDVFDYNTKGEVTDAANATLPTRNQSLAYDQIGNRLIFTTNSGTTSYTSNSLNQYSGIQAPGSSLLAPSYDADGNQTATGLGQAYVWDAENRLISVEPVFPANGDKKVLNTYDAQSRRVRRQVSTYTSGVWTLSTDERFVYDGWNVVAVLNALSGNVPLRTYTWGKDISGSIHGAGGVGGLLAVKDGATVYHYAYDANGNVSEVLSNAGSVVAHYEYTPFGDIFVASGAYASANEYRFSTKPLDSASGLYYYGFRYYSPSAGRWLSKDPFGERGGKNLYGMVGNNPLKWVDPLGLNPALAAAAGVSGSSAALGGGVPASVALANAGISTGVGLLTPVAAVGTGTLLATGGVALGVGAGIGVLLDNAFGISDALSDAISGALGYNDDEWKPNVDPDWWRDPDGLVEEEFQDCMDSALNELKESHECLDMTPNSNTSAAFKNMVADCMRDKGYDDSNFSHLF